MSLAQNSAPPQVTAIFANVPAAPALTRNDRDATDNLIDDLAGCTEYAVKQAATFPPAEGIRLITCDVEAERVYTSPECHRKAVTIYLTLEVQVDGEDLDANVDGVKESVAKILKRLEA